MRSQNGNSGYRWFTDDGFDTVAFKEAKALLGAFLQQRPVSPVELLRRIEKKPASSGSRQLDASTFRHCSLAVHDKTLRPCLPSSTRKVLANLGALLRRQ